jgi:lysophospholipase L1-like esterase
MCKASISRFLMLWVFFTSMLIYASVAGASQAVTTDATQPGAAVVAPQQPASVIPVPRQGNWMKRHESMNNRVKKGDVDLLFIGDSITQGWEGAGKEVWKKYYDKRNAVNLGISGDQTQHVLWRLENGNIDGISPKLAVIMIGTNNANAKHKADDIVAGVRAIVEKLRDKLPQTKILVLGIFPRGEDDNNPIRQVNMKANEGIAKLADGKMIFYLDIGEKFLDPDRKLSKEIMPDRLHLSPKGYTIWAESIEPEIVKLMGEK